MRARIPVTFGLGTITVVGFPDGGDPPAYFNIESIEIDKVVDYGVSFSLYDIEMKALETIKETKKK